MKVTIILYTIAVLLYWPVDSRMCYDCFCDYNWAANTGSCSSPNFQSNCILKEYGNQYCVIRSSYTSDNIEQRYFQSVAPDLYQDSHFFEATETISLSNTVWLPATINSISYGCDWDGCNNPSLAEYLPESFQMNINQTLLNSQLVNGESANLTCNLCTACINDIIGILCQLPSCANGTCYIDEIHNYVATGPDNCQYYFSSVCQPPTNPIQTPYVRIRAIYYIDLPVERQLEIDEMDLACTKSFCNSIEIVEILKGQIQTTINITEGFQPSRPTDRPTDQSTDPTTDQPAGGITATLKRSHVFLYFIFVLLLL
jgi:hypothetical protein